MILKSKYCTGFINIDVRYGNSGIQFKNKFNTKVTEFVCNIFINYYILSVPEKFLFLRQLWHCIFYVAVRKAIKWIRERTDC